MGGVLLYFTAVIIGDCVDQEPERVCTLINDFLKKAHIDAGAHIETVFNQSGNPENPEFINPKQGIVIISTEIKALVDIFNYLSSNQLGKITISIPGSNQNKILAQITDEDIEQSLESYKNVDVNTKFDSCGNKLSLEIILTQ
jgi:hypothetical protein